MTLIRDRVNVTVEQLAMLQDGFFAYNAYDELVLSTFLLTLFSCHCPHSKARTSP